MNRAFCQTIEARLVDLEQCPTCRAMVDALRQSLRCADVIWQDNWRDAQTLPASGVGAWRYIAVAACIVVAAGGLWCWSVRRKPVTKTPTLAEMEQHISAAGAAARLLAATDQLQMQASLRDVTESQYRYILEKYPDTKAAVQARLKLESPR
jgi:anti-sigma-K factor RskA